MTMFERRTLPSNCCWTFARAPTKQEPFLEIGIARIWNGTRQELRTLSWNPIPGPASYPPWQVAATSQFPRVAFIKLAPSKKLQYAGAVASGVFPPHPLSLFQLRFKFLCRMDGRMTRKNTWAGLAVAVLLSLPLTACKDAKTLQENEQLKAHVAELQKENGQLGNNLETITAARDELTKENEALKAEIKARKTKRSGTKAASRKRHRR